MLFPESHTRCLKSVHHGTVCLTSPGDVLYFPGYMGQIKEKETKKKINFPPNYPSLEPHRQTGRDSVIMWKGNKRNPAKVTWVGLCDSFGPDETHAL